MTANASIAATRPDQPGRIKVLFFSRGRGRGHAIPDIAIAEEIPAQANIDLHFASYATGANTFRAAGWPVVDLGLPEVNTYTHTLMVAFQLIAELEPDVVIAHEEFAALPAAHLAGVPSVLLTDWFPAANQVVGETVTYADAIVFFGEPGIFPLPAPVQRPPVYIGPIIRRMKYQLADRARARAELGLAERAFVVSVMPGAWATEEKAPIGPLILPAFRQLAMAEKNLLWLSKADEAGLQKHLEDVPQLRVIPDCSVPEQVMVASDVIITKGNRGTILDAASLGVRSLSLSLGANHVDDAMISSIRSNKAFNAKAVDVATLCSYLTQLAAKAPPPPQDLPAQGATEATAALLSEIRRLVDAARAATAV